LAATAEGVHYPILLALSALLAKIDDNNTRDLAGVLSALADSRAWAFSRPLFSDDKVRPGGSPAGADALRTKLVGLDRAVLAERLRTDRRVLDGALGRVARTLGGSEEEPEAVSGERVERGVREL
jgi:hypothetical protein